MIRKEARCLQKCEVQLPKTRTSTSSSCPRMPTDHDQRIAALSRYYPPEINERRVRADGSRGYVEGKTGHRRRRWGIRRQVFNHHTGFIVQNAGRRRATNPLYAAPSGQTLEMGQKAKEFVQQNYLLTRNLREYLSLMLALTHNAGDRMELEMK